MQERKEAKQVRFRKLTEFGSETLTAESDLEEGRMQPVVGNKEVKKLAFLELFAGLAGFSRYVKARCGTKVLVLTPLDALEGWDPEWGRVSWLWRNERL